MKQDATSMEFLEEGHQVCFSLERKREVSYLVNLIHDLQLFSLKNLEG